MFGLFKNKGKAKDKIDNLLIEKMREFSNETENSYRNLISYLKEDFPDTDIRISSYGIYKARFATNLMIAAGASFSKAKLGYTDNQEFHQDIQIGSAIAHEPFSSPGTENYLEKAILLKPTEKIIEYIVPVITPYQENIYSKKIDVTSDCFKKLTIYFHSCVSESISEKTTMSKVIEIEKPYFQNLTFQHLTIMSNFMKL